MAKFKLMVVTSSGMLFIVVLIYVGWHIRMTMENTQKAQVSTNVNGEPIIYTSDNTCYSLKSLTLSEARQFSFPFPPHANQIQFAEYSEMQAYVLFVRFQAPVSECELCAKKVLHEYLPEWPPPHNRADLEVLKPVSDVHFKTPDLGDLGPLKVPWFVPSEITDGFEGGGRGSQEPHVWIDAKRGIFYFALSD